MAAWDIVERGMRADNPEIVLLKGKLEDVELPVKQVDIIISEVRPSVSRPHSYLYPRATNGDG